MASTKRRNHYLGGLMILLLCLLIVGILGAACGGSTTSTPTSTQTVQPTTPSPELPTKKVGMTMEVVINQPGKPQDWPEFKTNLKDAAIQLPANSLVTVTIRNSDLGDTPIPNGGMMPGGMMPPGSMGNRFNQVIGTVDGTATVNGAKVRAIGPEEMAHTFTVMSPGMHLNIPIPGDGIPGKHYSEVTFSFVTPAPGTYTYRCYVPCGQDPQGWGGSMATMGYMIGQMTIA